MSNAMDFYDVQSMIRDARAEISAEIARVVQDAVNDLREQTDENLRAIQRTLDERTERTV